MTNDSQGMFFDEKVARKFAEHEQNKRSYDTANVFDIISTEFLKEKIPPLQVVDLFAGAHPDRYDKLFELLIKTNSKMDWVDYSQIMLKIAKEYLESCEDNRGQVISFIHKTYIEYLESIDDESLDLVLIKYSLDYIEDLGEFFQLLYKKMKKGGMLISTLTTSSNILKSHSTNAKYFYKNEPIPEGQEIKLKDGDEFLIKFFKESGNPNSGLIEGAQTTKYYFSQKTIINASEKVGFKASFGDWKQFIENNNFNFNLDVLILKK